MNLILKKITKSIPAQKWQLARTARRLKNLFLPAPFFFDRIEDGRSKRESDPRSRWGRITCGIWAWKGPLTSWLKAKAKAKPSSYRLLCSCLKCVGAVSPRAGHVARSHPFRPHVFANCPTPNLPPSLLGIFQSWPHPARCHSNSKASNPLPHTALPPRHCPNLDHHISPRQAGPFAVQPSSTWSCLFTKAPCLTANLLRMLCSLVHR